MDRVLIYGDSGRKAAELLRSEGYTVKTAKEIPAILPSETEADAALFLPSLGEEAVQAAGELARRHIAAIVIGKEPSEGHTGVFFLKCPVSPAVLLQSLSICREMHAHLRALEEENNRLKCAMDDLKLIDHAKCALIRRLGLTEQGAHRLIEKRSMDRRVPKRAIALEILNEYGSDEGCRAECACSDSDDRKGEQ